MSICDKDIMSAVRKNFLKSSMFEVTKHFLKSRPTPYISLKCSSAPDNNRNTGLTTYQVWSEEYLFTHKAFSEILGPDISLKLRFVQCLDKLNPLTAHKLNPLIHKPNPLIAASLSLSVCAWTRLHLDESVHLDESHYTWMSQFQVSQDLKLFFSMSGKKEEQQA